MLEDGLQPLGFAPDSRPYRPHLTLGRVRSGRNRMELTKLLEQTSCAATPNSADRLALMKSELTPHGPIHTILYASGH
ncbi:MAG: hypothetical protein LC725_05130 [Lentisphaerae bacterium]|nr:hypothetical protein [Lentisphaerota bacterium]